MYVASTGQAGGTFIIPGDRGGVADRPWIAAQTPIGRYIGQSQAFWGRPIAVNWRADSATGLDLYQVDDQHIRPGASSEAMAWLDDVQCSIVGPGDIVETGWSVPGAMIRSSEWGMVTIESIICGFVVDVLDDDGSILETIRIDGADPCVTEVVHPDPTVDPLTWTCALTARDTSIGEVIPVQGDAVMGRDLILRWSDARYGAVRQYRTTSQIVEGNHIAAQVWAVLRGPTDRYRVRVNTGLEGFSQPGGPDGAALRNAQRRN